MSNLEEIKHIKLCKKLFVKIKIDLNPDNEINKNYIE